MSIELKPCPFCGGEATMSSYTYSLSGLGTQYKVECEGHDCPAQPTVDWHYWTAEEAAEAWNTRAERAYKRTIMDSAGNPPYYTGGLALNDTCNGCSECGYPWRTHGFDHPNYCPNCGAKVVEE